MVKGFPVHKKLSEVSPDNPVFLTHASGHAAIANAKALEVAGVTAETEFSGDGEVIKDADQQPTGVLNEIAQTLVAKHIPAVSPERAERALNLALRALAENGITSFQDAGASREEIGLYESYKSRGKLTSRLWLMLAGSDEQLVSE